MLICTAEVSFSRTLSPYQHSSTADTAVYPLPRRHTPKENFPMGINKVFFAWRLLVVSCGKIWWLHTVLPTGNYAGQCRLLKQTGNTRLSSSGRSPSAAEEAMFIPNHPWQAGWLKPSATEWRVDICVCTCMWLLHTHLPLCLHMRTPPVCDRLYDLRVRGNGEGWTWLRKHQSGSIGASPPASPTEEERRRGR